MDEPLGVGQAVIGRRKSVNGIIHQSEQLFHSAPGGGLVWTGRCGHVSN